MSYLTNREAGSTDMGEAGPIGRLGPRRGVKPDLERSVKRIHS